MKNKILTKVAIVAMMLGLFSPLIVLEKKDNETTLKVSLLQIAEARRGNRNVNRNVNRNSNRNVNRNVNVNVNSGRYHGHHHHHGRYGSYHGHPILAFTTAVAIGSMVAAATMPKSCTVIIANGVSYKKCSGAYYQPFYQGDTLVYKSVSSPI